MLTTEQGQRAEEKALAYLKKQGLNLRQKNYRCTMGEVDLIMNDGSYVVFVEVRQRSSAGFGGGVASITHTKKQKIIKTATHYLLKYRLYEKCPLRFDVVSIDGDLEAITWIKDAFGLDY